MGSESAVAEFALALEFMPVTPSLMDIARLCLQVAALDLAIAIALALALALDPDFPCTFLYFLVSCV